MPTTPAIVAGPPAGRPASLETWSAEDRPLDYALQPYEAPAAGPDALAPVSFLFEALRLAGVEEEGRRLVARLRDALGRSRSVFGVWLDASGALSFELGFGPVGGGAAAPALETIGGLVAPFFRLDAALEAVPPRTMFSVRVTADVLRSGGAVALQAHDREGRSFEVRGRDVRLVAVAEYLRPRPDVHRLVALFRASRHLDPARTRLSDVLPPELVDAPQLGWATWDDAQLVTYSRVSTDQLAFCLARAGWPSELRALVEEHRPRLGHLRWEFGARFAGGAASCAGSVVHAVF